jgi:hypothetical protein
MNVTEDGKVYDPSWLVLLANEQLPELDWLPEALNVCRHIHAETSAYIYFVDPTNPNEPGSDWSFQENLILEDPQEGTLVLDILTNHRVGGIEFLSRLF